MTHDAQALHLIRVEILKAFSALWFRPDCRLAYQCLGRCIDHMAWRDASCLPDVQAELELADFAMHGNPYGKGEVAEAMVCLRRAALHVSTITNKNATRQGAA